MKRTIAITLTALTLAFSLVGCGGKNDGNVSDTSNGTVNSSSGRYQDGLSNSNNNSENGKSANNNSAQSQSGSQDSGLMGDMRDAASDMGDAGRAIGDAVTGGTPSTGMTGSR